MSMEFADFAERYHGHGLNPNLIQTATTPERVVPSPTPTALLRAIVYAAGSRRAYPGERLADQPLNPEGIPEDDIAAHLLVTIINASLHESDKEKISSPSSQLHIRGHSNFAPELGFMDTLRRLSSHQDFSDNQVFVLEQDPLLLASKEIQNAGLALRRLGVGGIEIPPGSLVAFSYDANQAFASREGAEILPASCIQDASSPRLTPFALGPEHRRQDFQREIKFFYGRRPDEATILEQWTMSIIHEQVRIALGH